MFTFMQGEDVVKRVEAVGSNSGATSKKVTIKDSGELQKAMPGNADIQDDG